MKNQRSILSVILSGAETVIGIAMVGSVKLWAPVCQAMLELASGKQVHMKCFYTGQALVLLGLLLIVNGIAQFLLNRRLFGGVISAMIGVLAILLVSGSPLGIGICLKAEMACHATASWARLLGGAAIVAGAASIFTGAKSELN
ncbi:MAG: DUF4418 family protein [bacterium]|nr:DUF4418 family protein [bacterium]